MYAAGQNHQLIKIVDICLRRIPDTSRNESCSSGNSLKKMILPSSNVLTKLLSERFYLKFYTVVI